MQNFSEIGPLGSILLHSTCFKILTLNLPLCTISLVNYRHCEQDQNTAKNRQTTLNFACNLLMNRIFIGNLRQKGILRIYWNIYFLLQSFCNIKGAFDDAIQHLIY